jgi:hypothetical protein
MMSAMRPAESAPAVRGSGAAQTLRSATVVVIRWFLIAAPLLGLPEFLPHENQHKADNDERATGEEEGCPTGGVDFKVWLSEQLR